MAQIAALILAAGVAGTSCAHPHAVRDAENAIMTARVNFGGANPVSQGLWSQDFSAKQSGNIWIVKQHNVSPGHGYRGTIIRLDAATGCIVWWTSID